MQQGFEGQSRQTNKEEGRQSDPLATGTGLNGSLHSRTSNRPTPLYGVF